MKRRSFLGTLAGLAAVSTIPLSAHDLPENIPTPPDTFSVGDWRGYWMGWRTPVNQTILFGVWFALPEIFLTAAHEEDGQYGWVSTTLGHCGQYRAFEVFDCTYYKEHGSKLNEFSSEAEKLAAKRLGLKNLLVSLKTGRPFPDHV
jgi:hypothetical protein